VPSIKPSRRHCKEPPGRAARGDINPGDEVTQAIANGKGVGEAYGDKRAADRRAASEGRVADGADYVRKNRNENTMNLTQDLYQRGLTHQEAREAIQRGRSNRLDDM
jgi:hypothetical protein